MRNDPTEDESIPFGPVAVDDGKHGLRIGYYDDDEHTKSGPRAVVYYCEPPLLFAPRYESVPYHDLRPVNTDLLWQRRLKLADQMVGANEQGASRDHALLYEIALEYAYVNSLLTERLTAAQENENDGRGLTVFISHATADKRIALWLSVDLAGQGHKPWLDAWEIHAGESIPMKIAEGLDACDVLLVLLSPRSVGSGWVEREWSTKYWNEARANEVAIIPVLLEDCEIPTLLRAKKYADFRRDYGDGVGEVFDALKHWQSQRT